MSVDLDALPTIGLMTASLNAQKELIALIQREGFSDRALTAWAEERGYDRATLLSWMDRIQAELVVGDVDPEKVRRRLGARLERIAHQAEVQRDFKAAVQATTAEAEVHGLTKSGPGVAIQINTNMPLSPEQLRSLSDEDLRQRLAEIERRAKAAAPPPVDDICA